MATDKPNRDSIFLSAIEIAEAERAAFIAEACGDDAELQQEVVKLVAAHFEAGSFLESPAVAPAATGEYTPDPAGKPTLEKRTEIHEGVGTVIGPYKLLQQIGEGGMGAVYMAEQTLPVKRKVALKIIKPGMDSKQVIARFEAERQALALMDHPNIARVLDAGTTETGRPYFVMELVKGVPITKYCDERRLTPKQRLELFIPVCQAVQHAHQKGIIHRDLKPSNVLVALYDDKPVPKVIDFGIAKATGQQLTDRTLFTEMGQVVGTLEYMSPEQAGLNQLDIDTRSDIYSLGVLLYELLTGTTPLERKRLKAAAMLEVLRLVREEEPPKPSTRLSTTDEIPSIAANRGLEPKKLSGLMRGELDWVVMKALEKDRGRRYETANGLAQDIERYLQDESVQACPPTVAYRTKKFLRRNKGPVLAASLVLFALIAGIVGTTIGLVEAEKATGEALKSADAEKLATKKANDALVAATTAQQQRALAQVNALRDVAPGAVPGILADLKANRAIVLPNLRARFAEESDRAKRMRLALALLPIGPKEMRDQLVAWMLQTSDPAETLLVRDALRPHVGELTKNLWHRADDPTRPRAERFRALAALASFDPGSPRWQDAAPEVAEGLVTANALHLADWVRALQPVRQSLLSPLSEVFRGVRLPEYRQVAADVLAVYAADQPRNLADLQMDADEKQFAVIFPKLKEQREHGLAALIAEMDKKPVVVKDKSLFETKGVIAGDDAKIKPSQGSPMPSKRFEVQLQAGKQYRLTMDSKDLDSYLVLQDKTGKEVAFDDDGGGNLNSLLLYTAPTDGAYTIFAASLQGTGSFVLKVVETMAGDGGKEKLAKRQANAAVALLNLNQPEKVWPLLKHSPDPRLRSYLIHRFGPLGANAKALAKRLDEEHDVTIRRALILSLGGFGEKEWSADNRSEVTKNLQEIYRSADDPGLHAASEWLLRTWKQEVWLKKMNDGWAKDREQREKRLDKITQMVAKEKEKTPPQWYVNGQGQTMVVIPGPVEFTMGSPTTEVEQKSYETQHTKRIGRTFAIAAKSVTMEQFREFLAGRTYDVGEAKYHRTADLPAVLISWNMAAAYCNRLSKEEGIAKDQWCYEGQGAKTKLKENYLSLSGYRLPTEAEMEYATRAGALTARYYGETDELLAKYAWYNKNSKEKPWPVGSLKPNDFGLFDVHGNVFTWCQESYKEYPAGRANEAFEDKEDESVIVPTERRVLRGGSFLGLVSSMRSADRGGHMPAYRFHFVGFRPARTLPQAAEKPRKAADEVSTAK